MSEETTLIRCAKCDQFYSKGSNHCPHCGARSDAKKNNSKASTIFVLCCVIIGGLYFGLTLWAAPPPPPKPPVYQEDSGFVVQPVVYLKQTLKDPKSYESISWGKLHHNDETGEYYVVHKYRAKNSFGGYVVDTKIFALNSEGKIIGVDDY